MWAPPAVPPSSRWRPYARRGSRSAAWSPSSTAWPAAPTRSGRRPPAPPTRRWPRSTTSTRTGPTASSVLRRLGPEGPDDALDLRRVARRGHPGAAEEHQAVGGQPGTADREEQDRLPQVGGPEHSGAGEADRRVAGVGHRRDG